MTQPKQMVLLTDNPHTTAHGRDVISEVHRGTFVECEQYEQETGTTGFIWEADLWDAFK